MAPSGNKISTGKIGSSAFGPGSEHGFTLMELGVVLAVIAVLGLLLLPAMAATHDRSNRAVCQFHLRQIAVAATVYAADYNDLLFPANKSYLYPNSYIPITLKPLASDAAAKQVGLNTNIDDKSIWTCPNRPRLPIYDNGQSQWIIGYQYFGGISTWNTPLVGSIPSYSPVKMTQSKPYWTLASDALLKVGSTWAGDFSASIGGIWDYEYGNIPPHRTADANIPQGGNQVFCDGSVQWIDLEKMYRLTSYNGALGVTDCCFYQSLVDFDLLLRSQLQHLRVTP